VRHADYIGSWLEVLREDNRAIMRAASAASKAADYLLAFRSQFAETAADAIGERMAPEWASADAQSRKPEFPCLRLSVSAAMLE
jgi:hypothetical protein